MKENCSSEWGDFTLADSDWGITSVSKPYLKVFAIVKAMVSLVFTARGIVCGVGPNKMNRFVDAHTTALEFMAECIKEVPGIYQVNYRGKIEILHVLVDKEVAPGFARANCCIKGEQLDLFVRGFCVHGAGGRIWQSWIQKK